jgi:hypothetical protein
MSGHDHNYERFEIKDASGNANNGGVRQFVIGTGGGYQYAEAGGPGTEISNANERTAGVMKLTLHPESYDWQFIPVPGHTFTDSGSTLCSKDASTPVDTTAPAVTITEPQNNATVSGSVIVKAQASDNVGVTKVELKVDNGTALTDTTSPYDFTWDTTSIANGSHNLTVQAYDSAGNKSPTSTITVNVNNTAACPSLPTSLGVVTQEVTIETAGTYTVWSRIKAANSINNSFYLEIGDSLCGVIIGDSTGIADDDYTWVDYKNGNSAQKVTVTLAAGTHSLRYVGREAGVRLDKVLLVSDSCVPTGDGANCSVVPDTQKPTISITSPAAGSTVSGKVSVAVSANDTGGSGLSRVDFLVNGSVVSTNQVQPYGFSWDTTGLAGGNYTLSVKAYDGAGNVSDSAQNPGSTITVTISSGRTIREDINQDGKVDIVDFSLLASKFGLTGNNLGRADIDGNGKVDIVDFSLLAGKFGQKI